MDKQTLHQCCMDVTRLENAADSLRDLSAAYKETRNDLEITKSALKIIATWAKVRGRDEYKDFDDIHAKAMDTLAVISEANR